MPTVLPAGWPKRRRDGKTFAINSALLVSALLLGATVQIAAQVYFAPPIYPFNLTHITLQYAER